jgi:ferredoxin
MLEKCVVSRRGAGSGAVQESSAIGFEDRRLAMHRVRRLRVQCPNAAISLKRDMYVMDPKKCTGCEGHFDTPQCAVVCPAPDTCVPA